MMHIYPLTCPGCGVTFKRRGTYMNHGRGKKATCTKEMRFWGRVAKADGCWFWQGRRDALGYGRFERDGDLVFAHRVAWIFTNGPVPEGLDICHHCDQRACCNPSHLYAGTAKQNMADMFARGRQGASKLTAHEVREIFKADQAIESRELAEKYGVTYSTIWAIRTGRKWQTITKQSGDGE